MEERPNNEKNIKILLDWAVTTDAVQHDMLERVSKGMVSTNSVDAKRRMAGELLEQIDPLRLKQLVEIGVKEHAAARQKVTWALGMGMVGLLSSLSISNPLGLSAQYTIGGMALFVLYSLSGSLLGSAIALATIFIWTDGKDPLDPLRPHSIEQRLLVGTALGTFSAFFCKPEIRNFLFEGSQNLGGTSDAIALSPFIVGFMVRAAIGLLRQMRVKMPGS